MKDEPSRRILKEALKRLADRYDLPVWHSEGPAVDELVATVLSQNTSAANSSAGFRRLKERFATWREAADAPVARIERCIRVSGLSRIKAPRIRRILRQVQAERGRIDLELLASWPPERAAEYLIGFDGVGPKTACCVLMFSFGMPLLPVDTHIHRIALRLGVLAAGASAEEAHRVLTPLLAPGDRYAMHLLLIRHGRLVCKARRPQCGQCVLLELCPHGRKLHPSRGESRRTTAAGVRRGASRGWRGST